MANTTVQKAQFLQKVRELMTSLGQINDQVTTLSSIYTTRGYDPAAADPVLQTDLDLSGVTLADMAAMVTVVTQLQAFFSGTAVATSAAYKATINKWRQV
jgi:hypothetical protein